MNAYEVSRLLQAHTEENADYDDGWYYWDNRVPYSDDTPWGDPVTVDGLGVVEMANTYTGGEGGGESAEMVFRVTDVVGSVRYYRMAGWYASYSGTEWDGDLTEVKPKQKTITVFE